MTNRLDHEKVSKADRVRRNGADPIAASDRTLMSGGYPSAADMAKSPPSKRRSNAEILAAEIKREADRQARVAAQRTEPERSPTKPRVKTQREASRNAGPVGKQHAAKKKRDVVAKLPPAPSVSFIPEAGTTVQQRLPGKKGTRVVQVEVSALQPSRHASKGTGTKP